MSTLRTVSLLLAAAVALTLSSCAASKRKPTFPVTGKILINGKAAQHATVVFHPVGDGGPEIVKPRGKVAADGSYTLTTYDTDDGAPAGQYQVTVELWLSSGRDDIAPSNRLNPKLSRPETSGLTATVNTGKTEIDTFALR